jgi:hypothetical protein
MSMPPAILDLRIAKPDGRPVHLWLPLFLMWPLLLVLGVLALVLTALADVILYALGKRYHHYTFLVARSFAALGATRGMVIRINDGETAVAMTVM